MIWAEFIHGIKSYCYQWLFKVGSVIPYTITPYALIDCIVSLLHINCTFWCKDSSDPFLIVRTILETDHEAVYLILLAQKNVRNRLHGAFYPEASILEATFIKAIRENDADSSSSGSGRHCILRISQLLISPTPTPPQRGTPLFETRP